MARKSREKSATGVYHVMMRGFLDDLPSEESVCLLLYVRHSKKDE